MRVSVRRLRALLRAARPMLDRTWSERLRVELGWLGAELGPARDLDVLIEHLRGESVALGEDDSAAFTPVLERLEADRERARSHMLASLDSKRYLKLLDRLDRAVAKPRIVRPDIAAERFARQEHGRLAKRIARLAEPPTDDQLHATRIAAKRARYAAELLGGDGRDMRRYALAARSLQDVLGAHQDACVAEERLRSLAAAFRDTATHLACGRLIERERRRRLRQRAAFPDAWRALETAAERAFP